MKYSRVRNRKREALGTGHLTNMNRLKHPLIFHPPTIFEWFTIGSVSEPLEEAIATAYSSLF